MSGQKSAIMEGNFRTGTDSVTKIRKMSGWRLGKDTKKWQNLFVVRHPGKQPPKRPRAPFGQPEMSGRRSQPHHIYSGVLLG